MSILFGTWALDGRIVDDENLLALAHPTQRYAEDGTFLRADGRLGLGYQPYFTNERSRLESAPVTDVHGNMLSFDGRLDNYRELCWLLDLQQNDTSDSRIMLAAFVRWGEECFSKFIGDWALALWDPSKQSLYLARDHAGTRTLYYATAKGTMVWATYLESFFHEGTVRELDENYVASYLTGLPIKDKTPYKGISAVTPGNFIVFHHGILTRHAHWLPTSKERIRYQSDLEYEQHFFSLFQQSVERRTGPGAPILAQLSGGMDSSSIVCMSDYCRRYRGASANGLLDTVSFYDDEEASWNERPYFAAVETHRCKSGIHLDASFVRRVYHPLDSRKGRYLYPGGDQSSWDRECSFLAAMGEADYCSILSGVGGDEVLGGVPTSFPELADALFELRAGDFFKQAMRWSVVRRKPLLHLVVATVREMLQLYGGKFPLPSRELPKWLTPRLRSCIEETDQSRRPSLHLRPSSIVNGQAWWTVLDSLPHRNPGLVKRYEYRYPYLDRDLVDFLFRIPREQLVRPGQHRSLMKRALAPILPEKVLERRQKAFVRRGPVASLQNNYQALFSLLGNSYAEQRGYIDAGELRGSLTLLLEGKELHAWPEVLRAILLEIWLRSIFGKVTERDTSSSRDRKMVNLA